MESKIWTIFFVVILVLLFLGYRILKKDKNLEINIIAFVILLTFFVYTFFTVNGSVRLSIALHGHPDVAYSTKLVSDYYSNYSDFNGKRKYVRSETRMEDYTSYFECRYYGPIRVTVYYGWA